MSLPERVFIADTHCHLDFHAFDDDRGIVVERARSSGVKWILNPGTDIDSSRLAIRLSQDFPEVYAAVGVHPSEVLQFREEMLGELKQLTAGSKVVAIGEIGLDYYRDQEHHELQRQVFQHQLNLAAEVGLPVIIHNRDASLDLIHILEAWFAGLVKAGSPLANCPGVLHSFSAGEEVAQKATGLNFLIGITGPVTFRNASLLQQVVAGLPLERILTETDSPFLTPHPHRGQRNEPAYVTLVAEKIASIQNQPLTAVAERTVANAKELFNW